MKSSCEIVGADQVFDKADKALDEIVARTAEALQARAAAVRDAAAADCPVRTGALQQSAYASPVAVESGALTVEVGFKVEYAPEVHERLEAVHRAGHAKFLEQAAHAEGATLAQSIADTAKAGG